LPGMAPTDYEEGDSVELRVNKLTSAKTQVPRSFYDVPFCQPLNGIVAQPMNLGEVLAGENIFNSAFSIQMNRNVKCKVLCVKTLTEQDADILKKLVDGEYLANWLIDNLPIATTLKTTEGLYKQMEGFPLGFQDGAGRTYINNHFAIKIFVHKVDAEMLDTNFEETEFRVVGLELEPSSVDYGQQHAGQDICRTSQSDRFAQVAPNSQVIFTYDVDFVLSEMAWSSRWDAYLQQPSNGQKVHWFSIANSLCVILFLTALVATILLRTLHNDIRKYNEFLDSDSEETGWKLVSGDVFRRPGLSRLFAVLLGSGFQITFMALFVIFLGGFGLMNPAYRGGLIQSMLILFMLMGSVAGYISARFYKFFRGNDWKNCTLMTAFLYPGCVSALFFLLDLLLWGQKSCGAVPFTTMLAIAMLWFGVSVPLVFLGAYFGYRAETLEVPTPVNSLPREIPEQHWTFHPAAIMVLGGLLPFGAVFTELYFVMSSIWKHRFYDLFGFLVIAVLVVIVTCVEMACTITYFCLAREDYRWWWRSYLCGAGSGVYIFAYAIAYAHAKLDIENFAGILLYFGYMLFVSVSFAMMCGSVGSFSTFFFVRIIYGAIKND
jgi:transmembrane 9 superfamily protein 2/4